MLRKVSREIGLFCVAVVLLWVGAVVLAGCSDFDGNLMLNADSSVTLGVNETAKVSCSISYANAITTAQSSNEKIFSVKENNIVSGYIVLESFDVVGSATLVITAQFDTATASAEVSVVVKSEADSGDSGDSDDDSDGTETSYSSIVSGKTVDSTGAVIVVGSENKYLQSGKIPVSSSGLSVVVSTQSSCVITGAYLVDGDTATLLSTSSEVSGTMFYHLTTSEIGKFFLVTATDSTGSGFYVIYSIVSN